MLSLTPPEEVPQNRFKTNVAIAIGLGFGASVVAMFIAEQRHNIGLAKLAAVIADLFVMMGIVGVATLRPRKTQVDHLFDSETSKLVELQESRDEWLLRLVVATGLGICLVVMYSIQWLDDRSIIIAGVALLSAGAAWFVGLIIGFIFGIPHLSNTQSANPGIGTSNADDPPQRYRPSTSLEEVADWLTKIIVGVTLTQLNKVPSKLNVLASHIGTGIGNAPSDRVLALAICVYFPACGFLFGFLWARLYMLEAFDFASSLKRAIRGLVDRVRPPGTDVG